MAKEYTLTATPKSSEALALKKIDELIDAVKSLCAKLDADATVTDTDYAALISAKLKKTAEDIRK